MCVYAHVNKTVALLCCYWQQLLSLLAYVTIMLFTLQEVTSSEIKQEAGK